MKNFILLLLVALVSGNLKAQEVVQDLSKKAYKGFLYDVNSTDGQLTVTYKIPGDKKGGESLFETYSFDSSPKFLKTDNVAIAKETKPDKTVTQFYGFVGGGSSFSVLSMKLKLGRRELIKSWSHEKQAYVTSKVLSNEIIKPKDENGKTYRGYASFVTANNDRDDDLVILAANDSKDKKEKKEFYLLGVNSDLTFKETPIGLSGAQTLVYSNQLDSKDIVFVFAPDKGEGDPTAYTFLKYSQKGELKNKVTFKSPSSNLLIMNANEADGSVYFCGTSTKSNDAYAEVFSEYAADVVSPGYSEANNIADQKWLKKSNEDMDNFHLLKFTGNALDFASTAPVAAFKPKFKTSPNGKGASVYKGSKFHVERFYITADNEYLIAGQLTGTANLGMGNPVKTYEDLVCLYFDKAGQLKTQFGVGKLNNDKKSEIFYMSQDFHLGKDGKTLYWEIKEVKGMKGYESFVDAYVGNETLYPVFFPRIAKLDLASNTVSDFKILGNEKYFLRRDFPSTFNKADNSITYIGHDEDFKKLWLGKYTFE